jgi:hypothetical protein
MSRYLQFRKEKFKDQRIVAFVGSNAPIDPEETKQKIAPLVEQTPEFAKQQELAARKNELTTQQYRLIAAFNKLRNPLTGQFVGDPKKRQELNAKYAEIQPKLNALETEIIEHSKQTEKVNREIFSANAVYSAPRDAVLIDKDQAKHWSDLIQNVRKNDFLLENGDIVAQDEIEADRIANLSPAERLLEKERSLQTILAQATQMRSQWEIEGHADALEKSQDWYRLAKEEIEAKYTSG